MNGLSVCIPVYNFNVQALVEELLKQLGEAGIPSEIILMDDASAQPFRAQNHRLEAPALRYIQLEENIGRSAIRNRLAREARYPYLIFMDCDSQIATPYYISNYLALCRPGVVCYGGRIYHKNPPRDNTFLRWKYGVGRECSPAETRALNPNYGFSTNNFLIDKTLFETIRFDENLKGYGHEDTFFGLELLAKQIPIIHIDNPLIHIGLESAALFLEKTRNSIANLNQVNQMLKQRYPQYINHSKLSQTHGRITRLGLAPIAAALFRRLKPRFEKNLLGENPSLRTFDLYRLGLLLSIGKR